MSAKNRLKNHVKEHIFLFGKHKKKRELCNTNLKETFFPLKLYLLETNKKELRDEFLFILQLSVVDDSVQPAATRLIKDFRI